MKRKRTFCHYCGGSVIREYEEGIERDFCTACRTFFYENPLPVVSVIPYPSVRVTPQRVFHSLAVCS